eukprot:69627-Amphidinium_carterae.3
MITTGVLAPQSAQLAASCGSDTFVLTEVSGAPALQVNATQHALLSVVMYKRLFDKEMQRRKCCCLSRPVTECFRHFGLSVPGQVVLQLS